MVGHTKEGCYSVWIVVQSFNLGVERTDKKVYLLNTGRHKSEGHAIGCGAAVDGSLGREPKDSGRQSGEAAEQ